MTQKQKKKSAEATAPVPDRPVPPHVEAAVASYRAHSATQPPGISIIKGKAGAVTIDTDPPGLKYGMVPIMEAVGTHHEAFFTGYLKQITQATPPTKAEPDHAANVNAALGFIQGLKPRDEVEASLAAQMLATHNAAMTFARRLTSAEMIPQQDSAINAYTKLTRTFTAQMDALKRYRSTGEQKVTVQHVTVSDGGQAIVGGTVTAGGGSSKKDDTTP